MDFEQLETHVEIAPAGALAREVRRCLSVLYGTRAGSVALDREFGLSWEGLDRPMEAAKAFLSAEIIAKTQRYEPRVRVLEVTWNVYADRGILAPKVRCELVEN